jgi:spore germination protein YaaH
MQQAANEVATAKVGPLQPFRKAGTLPLAPAPSTNAPVGGGSTNILSREVFGFALFSSLADPNIGYPSWNFDLLSTVAVFGLHVNWDGHLITNDSGYAVWNSSQMTGLISTAHQHGAKVVVTIILQDFQSGTPNMCAGLHNRAVTVADTVNELKNHPGVDGVNVDYEGLQVSCAIGDNPRLDMVDFVKQLRGALPAGSYLSVDTYASSASDPYGFFDIAGINPYTDSFFVMAYDSDRSNYNHPPLNCSRYCLSPVSPLTGYFYNDTRAGTEYSNAVPASKVILGLPYYSRADCVSSWAPNQYPSGQANFNLPFTQSVTMASDPTNSNYVINRDAPDQAGQSPWSTWTSNSSPVCPMEMYWDDPASLSNKYAFVNRASLRGVGIWNLNQGGGRPELWNTIAANFTGWQCQESAAPGPASTPPTTDLFIYGPSTGGSCVELANGKGAWTGKLGPVFALGWQFYAGHFSGSGLNDLFLFNPSTGSSYVELANGSGGWSGVAGPTFSTGWQFYPGTFSSSGLTDLFLYNPTSGASYVERANGSGGWSGMAGPRFSVGWQFTPGRYNAASGLTDLFLYNPSNGFSYVEFANGSGGWSGVAGPLYSAGWEIHPGHYDASAALTDLFLYNPTSGTTYVELANGAGSWKGVAGPLFSTGWQFNAGHFNAATSLSDLFLYSPSDGRTYVEFASGGGSWSGVAGPPFATGWSFFPGHYNAAGGLTDLFLYNRANGSSYVEMARGGGAWSGVPGPQFSAGWDVVPGNYDAR